MSTLEQDLPVASTSSLQGSEEPDDGPKKKRSRLSCSCERCRKKKIKCDEQTPKCGPCAAAGAECVVTKPSSSSYVEPIRRKTGLATPVRKRKQMERAAARAAATDEVPSADLSASSSTAAALASSSTPWLHLSTAPPLPASYPYHVPPHAFPPAQPSLPVQQKADQHVSPASNTSSLGIPLSDAEALLHMHRTPAAPNQPSTSPASSLWQPDEQPHPRVNDVGLVHTQDAERRKFSGASSSSIFLKWLDSESSGTQLTQHLRYGVTTSETYTFPGLIQSSPVLPKPELIQFFLKRFFDTLHAMFPIVDESHIRALAASPDLLREDPLSAVLLELVLSHGADTGDQAPEYIQEGERLFQHAWLSLPALLASPFRVATQCLGLICLGLRSRNRDGAAWNFAGIAVRIAQSLGLHHQHAGESAKMDARIWFCLYCMEKTLAFECGRPSSIEEADCTITPADCGNDALLVVPGHPPLNLFAAFISICQELSFISSSLFKRGSTKLSTVEALRIIGEADARLLKCIEEWPIDLRPQFDGHATAGWLLPFTARVHSLFFLALITLHRLSLFDEGTIVTPHLAHPALQPYASRLRMSGTICAQAARATLTLLERLSQTHPSDRSWTCHCVLTAIYVIAIRTYKMPGTWQSRSDLLFLKNACDFASTRYRELGFDERFIALLPKLVSKIEQKIAKPHQPSRPPTRSNSPAPQTSSHSRSQSESANGPWTDWAGASATTGLTPAATVPSQETEQAGTAGLDGADTNEFQNLLDLWPTMLLGDGSQLNDSFIFGDMTSFADLS